MGRALEVLRAARLSRALIDISIPWSADIPVWPGDTPYSCGWTARRETGSSVNLGALTMSAHAGTHADAPLHVESAWGASETLPTRVFVGGVVVIALPERTASDSLITRALLERLLAPQPRHRLDASNPFDIAPVEIAAVDIVPDATSPSGLVPAGIVPQRLLCCTGRSVAHGEFPSEWPVLDEAAAAWLVQSGLILWGTDAPSVDARASTSLPVHHCLFEGGAYVLENLALDGVAPGRYELLAQPLSVQGADAAPVRALLRRW